ncbi:TetR/AcrR family transcriptional regulator [Amycolatopsis acidiphila]|uniref:TetR family transcriptional regulator n=1 Tax=Amycolatopsis acidiphila TaxID=715473 RepID=A0A558ANS3_9PSEU|nr:TetR/AcrR family transcriptional regulator [Amycolatopsis acidiphila]TVT25913.1 TetR family transcriptional regulator [Amycolatopsis acidiphila]UIJ63382.1 TetR/AcrR family transcriptional regulator [Amycolatopsis acidiphila]GHG75291.1 TetR family transcriptional regulator [Amycolatopsis acidiphila]
MTDRPGRRERKKAATRRAIADAALKLFLAHGFDAVSISDIAAAADVARTTLFAHFPSKEALVFDQDHDQQERLVNAVRHRPAGTSIPEALRQEFHIMLREARETPELDAYHQLIEQTPTLCEYATTMWLRHEDALTDAISTDLGADPETFPACRALARFALDVYTLARTSAHPELVIDQTFQLIETGWTATSTSHNSASSAHSKP